MSKLDWKFEPEDIVQEDHPKPSPVPGAEHQPKKEYRVKYRLFDPDNQTRYYYLETEEGGDTLLSAGAIEHSYSVIGVGESRVWEEGVERSDGA